ncbi:MAG TPA: YMGG-like glycine zipper-containing protein [Gemmatimonadaceae bacterium]
MTTRLVRSTMLAGLVALAACGNDEAKRIEQLKKDLMLAGAYPYQPYMTPLEQGSGYAPGYQPQPYRNAGYTPVTTRSAPVVRRTPVYTSATTTRTQATRVVKNTKRDAIIGAAAGAAIGAVVSRDRVKGAVIGGVAGGILGAVIGNNVDVKRIPLP